jgi:hypothetical protein
VRPAAPSCRAKAGRLRKRSEGGMGHRLTQICIDELKEHPLEWACFKLRDFICVHLCQSVAYTSHELNSIISRNSSTHPGVSIFQNRKCLQISTQQISEPVLSSMFFDFGDGGCTRASNAVRSKNQTEQFK